MTKKKYKYKIGEKLFSRKYGWYLGSFVRTDIRSRPKFKHGHGQPIFMVKMRSPEPSWSGAALYSQNEQGYGEMMIGNEAEIRRQGLEPLMNGKHEKRGAFYPGQAAGFDRDAYVFPGPFHPRFGETTTEGVIVREPDLELEIREYLVLVKPEDIESVKTKLRKRAEYAKQINPSIELATTRNDESLNGLPADVYITKSESGYWQVSCPEDGECGAYLFRPMLRYD